jgi:hypothetical protein
MKVNELINLLNDRNQDAEVIIFCNDIYNLDDVVELEPLDVFDLSNRYVGINCTVI